MNGGGHKQTTETLRSVLAAKRKHLRSMGKGQKPNAARAITPTEEREFS